MGGVAGRTESAFRVMTQTIAVQSQLLSNAAQVVAIDFKKLVGGPLLSVLSFGRTVLEVFHALPAPIQGVAFGLIALFGAVALVGGAFLLLAPAIAAAGTILAGVSFAGIIGGAVAAAGVMFTIIGVLAVVGAIIGAVYLAWQHNWLGIRDTVSTLVPEVVGWVNNLIASLGGIAPAIQGVQIQIGGAVAGIGSELQGLKDTIGPYVSEIVNAATSAAQNAGASISNALGLGDVAATVAAQMAAIRDAASPTTATAAPTADAIAAGQENLDNLKAQLNDARDNLNGVRDAAANAGATGRQAGGAAAAGFRPFAEQIDAVDKAIARIQLGQLEKAYARISRRPINPNRPTSMLPRLELQKQILEHEQIIATPFGFGSAAARNAGRTPSIPASRNPAVLASEAAIHALERQIHAQEKALDTAKELLNVFNTPLAKFTQSGLPEGRVGNPIPFAQSGIPEGGGGFPAPFAQSGRTEGTGITAANLAERVNPYRDFTQQVKDAIDPIPTNTHAMLSALDREFRDADPMSPFVARMKAQVDSVLAAYRGLIDFNTPGVPSADSGRVEGTAGRFQYPSPGASSSNTTNTQNQNFNAPLVNVANVDSQASADAVAQAVMDSILQAGQSTTNSAPAQLPGNSNPGY